MTHGCAFLGLNDGRQHLGVQIPPKPWKIGFYRHVRAATIGFDTNDVIEDWRHWLRRRQLAASPSLAERRILFMASWISPLFCIFQWLRRNDSVSWWHYRCGTVWKFSFCKIYTVFVGNVVCRMSHKQIPYAVSWKASKTSKCLSWRKMFYHYRTSCIIRRHLDFDIAKVVVVVTLV